MIDKKTTFFRWLKVTILVFSVVSLISCANTRIFSSRINPRMLEAGNVKIPLGEEGRAIAQIEEFGQDDLSGMLVQNLISLWAEKDLPAWDINGAKVNAPRILLAKLTMGVDIEKVNNYLLHVALEPWSDSGSTWLLRNGGDYDFSEVPLTAILYKFGHRTNLLYPETRDHLLHTLLIESGDRIRPYVPGSLNLVPDTENHILMTEGSRYLKNQWLRNVEGETDPEYNNHTNGVETFLINFIEELMGAGLFEFNALPYSGYTITALLNLEAFAEDPLASKARELLDTIMFKYALGSLDMRRCVPFRRLLSRAGTTSLQSDDASMISRILVSLDDPNFNVLPITERLHNSFYAAVMSYRLPEKTLALIKNKENPYFVLLGRGPKASPELFSGGPGYLLSAGGVNRGKSSMIASRPITLILSDDQIDYTECFHIKGRGDYQEWNNTGVFRNFAISNAPVTIPSWAEPLAIVDNWRIYRFNQSLTIAVFNNQTDEQYGIIVLFPEYSDSPQMLAKSLSDANSDSASLLSRFVWPEGDVLTYDINAPKDKWVITSYNGDSLDRNFDSWPRISDVF